MAYIGRVLKDHLVLIPLLLAELLAARSVVDQTAWGLIQPDLGNLLGWGIHNLSGQPSTVPHHHLSKKLFLMSQGVCEKYSP